VIIGLSELLKRFGLPNRFIPLAGFSHGFILFFFFTWAPDDPKKAILFGTVLGLSAVGLFSGTKNTLMSPEKIGPSKSSSFFLSPFSYIRYIIGS